MGFWSNIGDLVSNTVEFVNENKGKIAGLTVGLILAPATGGTSLALCGGLGFMAGAVMDADMQKRENENKKLNLLGKVSEDIRKEVNGLQDQRNQEASKLNTLDQQIVQKQNKLNDPNTPEQEKIQIRSELASLVSQRDNTQRSIKNYDDKINNLIKQAGKTASGNKPSLELDPQTKLIIGAIIFLVIYFTLIKDKER